MRNNYQKKDMIIKQSRFPLSLFWVIVIGLFLVAGVHTALYLVVQRLDVSEILQTHIILIYWLLVAAGLTWYIRWQVKKTYEQPLQKISQATERVAKGDFSVYIPPTNTPDQLDYLDMMIMDINKMIEELGSIETLKTDFVSNVSHEMKTPLSVIKNYAELLQAENISEERRLEYATSIKDSAERMSTLISNILRLNKLEHQRIIPEVESYDVCRQLCECVLEFEMAWEKKEIELDIDMEERAMIVADESLLQLVWNNLLSNAIKFTEPGGRIGVKQTTKDKKIQIAVSDSGCGIDQDSIKHIFDKFYQGDTSHAMEGNGLGLALVYRVLTLLGGDINVESKIGEGSTFIVTLPAAETEEENPEKGNENNGK